MTIPKLRSPIVLVHGLFGFDKIQFAGATLASYFPAIPELMRSAGNRVLVPTLTPTGGVEQRASQLKEYLLKNAPNEPVHLFAHSMGGLDARYMISRLGMADRILSLTTIATPHRGTSFADWGVNHFERVVKPLLNAVGMPYQAFYDLTRPHCQAFNEKTPDAPDVRYFSVAGRHDGHYAHPEWLVPFGIVKAAEGDNDGIVSIASARYGDQCDIWDGDHLSVVNWPNPFRTYRGAWHDPAPRYGALLQRLADLGW